MTLKKPLDVVTGGISKDKPDYPDWAPLRRNMGYILNYAEKMDLATMFPHSELSSTRYCIANPCQEYLVSSQRVASTLLTFQG